MTKPNSDEPVPGWGYCCNCTAYVDPEGIVEGKHLGHLITQGPPGAGYQGDFVQTMQAIAALAIARGRRH